ncbi:helix-turn-helix domain-containing protein [Streptomyces lutosisoli]|uniref:helix-turn-helix domain-containing protein n=1 Tax=Streptomyces lutosisoli TaxID=2665721 RepID=UPI003AA93ADB
MRYAQGGGLTDAGRAAREWIRLQAVERFEGGDKNREIATALRVSERSVERWRRQWRERGEAGVLSKGSPRDRGSARSKSSVLSGSWNAARWATVGPTSGGRWPG